MGEKLVNAVKGSPLKILITAYYYISRKCRIC